MNIWIADPKTGERSVTLTLLAVSFLALVVASALQVAGVVNNISSLMELFLTTSASYLGRRINFNGKSFSAEQVDKKDENS